MPKYTVTVQRTMVRKTDIEVDAASIREAEFKALDKAGDIDFNSCRYGGDPEYAVSNVEGKPDISADEFCCDMCGEVNDVKNSVRMPGGLICFLCCENDPGGC